MNKKKIALLALELARIDADHRFEQSHSRRATDEETQAIHDRNDKSYTARAESLLARLFPEDAALSKPTK